MLLPQSRPMWLSKFRRDRDRQGRKRPRRRLAVHSLECLEDRTVLSSISVGPMDTAGLYAAIAAANADTGHGTVNIQLSPGTYTLTGAQLEITRTSGAVTIHGNGAVIDAAGLSRVLETDAGTTVTVQDAELTDGKAVGAGFGAAGQGGGILNLGGSLSLNHVILDNDKAFGSGGGPFNNTGGAGQGGGLYTSGGSVSILNSTLSDDFAYGGTGTFGQITGGTGGDGQGGGLYATGGGSVSILNSNFSSDLAHGGTGFFGGPFAIVNGGNGGKGQGGGLYIDSGTLSLKNSSVSGNTAQGGNGGSGNGAFVRAAPTAATAAMAKGAACTTAAACSP